MTRKQMHSKQPVIEGLRWADYDGTPHPETPEALSALMALPPSELSEAEDGYSQSADAMMIVTVAAFNYMAQKVGATGFMAGWAAMGALGYTSDLGSPYAVVDGSRLPYPQYDYHEKLNEWAIEWLPSLADQARESLNGSSDYMHPDVKQRLGAIVVAAERAGDPEDKEHYERVARSELAEIGIVR